MGQKTRESAGDQLPRIRRTAPKNNLPNPCSVFAAKWVMDVEFIGFEELRTAQLFTCAAFFPIYLAGSTATASGTLGAITAAIAAEVAGFLDAFPWAMACVFPRHCGIDKTFGRLNEANYRASDQGYAKKGLIRMPQAPASLQMKDCLRRRPSRLPPRAPFAAGQLLRA